MKGNKNLEILIQILVLLLIVIFLFYEMITGNINNFIHPRYHIGIWFAIIILFVFVINLLNQQKNARHNSEVKKYVIYFIPILFLILFPSAKEKNTDIVMAQGNQITNTVDNSITDSSGKDDDTEYDTYNTTPNSSSNNYGSSEENTDSGYDDYVEPADKSDKYLGETVDGATVITDDEYGNWYYDLYDYLNDFKGKRYQFLAQVYSLEGLKENEFLAGRYIMVCCAADAAGYGLICASDERSELKEDEWILVTATIGEYDYEGTKVPYLTDAVIKKAKAPKDEYVYYSFY